MVALSAADSAATRDACSVVSTAVHWAASTAEMTVALVVTTAVASVVDWAETRDASSVVWRAGR